MSTEENKFEKYEPVKKDKVRKVMFEFKWIFNPDCDVEDDSTFKHYLKKLYLQGSSSNLLLKHK
jgi:hypothetical protein